MNRCSMKCIGIRQNIPPGPHLALLLLSYCFAMVMHKETQAATKRQLGASIVGFLYDFSWWLLGGVQQFHLYVFVLTRACTWCCGLRFAVFGLRFAIYVGGLRFLASIQQGYCLPSAVPWMAPGGPGSPIYPHTCRLP